uniref:Uncharacterized protein n=1 Tax=Physcomitrium patens TaxID=3218 RepID=A0A7I3ZQE4_PHYPA
MFGNKDMEFRVRRLAESCGQRSAWLGRVLSCVWFLFLSGWLSTSRVMVMRYCGVPSWLHVLQAGRAVTNPVLGIKAVTTAKG